MLPKIWLIVGALLGASAIGLGAYHAHGLEKRVRENLEAPVDQPLSPELQTKLTKRLDDHNTAVRYQMFQAVALLIVGVLAERAASRTLTLAGCFLFVGLLCFAGPLYLLSLFESNLHWSIIPSGGLLMIVGWLLLAVAAARRKSA